MSLQNKQKTFKDSFRKEPIMSKNSKNDTNNNLDEDTERKVLEERLYKAIKDLNLPVKEVTEKDLKDWD